jgi:hypothetical protein|tara:strand:+ start:1003 stop:1107 length:105 start_codon:yes stop_codon:yes gene_type:complete
MTSKDTIIGINILGIEARLDYKKRKKTIKKKSKK